MSRGKDSERQDDAQDEQKDDERLKPLSLHPLSLEKALRGFMQADPEKVEKRLRDEDDEAGNA